MSLVDPAEITPIDRYLAEQGRLTPVERFAALHDADLIPTAVRSYRQLVPVGPPGPGQQLGFDIDLDSCTGCKSCVTACHSLNGLDADESWRTVGLLHGGPAGSARQQTVTTACHHCVDPACLNGCPVDAYDKDPITGIVAHLDDQCIGCGYCVLTCPYEVPRFNESRGIVRKCDMCKDRLAEGEAPACVQACPNGAIRIAIVDTVQVAADAATGSCLIPGAPASSLTIPATVYRTTHPEVAELVAADHVALRPSQAHSPLAVMLVMTQLAVGAVAAELAALTMGRTVNGRGGAQAIVAALMGIVALTASTLHLGRPRYAYRAVIGLRHSWLSREIVAFGAFAVATALYAGASFAGPVGAGARTALLATSVVTGGVGVFCSALIYAVTGKTWWRLPTTGAKFALTTAACGAASLLTTVAVGAAARGAPAPPLAADLAMVVIVASAVKLIGEAAFLLRHRLVPALTDRKRTALLLTRDLAPATSARFAAGAAGGMALPALVAAGSLSATAIAATSVLGLVVLLVGELIERDQFFRAVVSPRMPGSL